MRYEENRISFLLGKRLVSILAIRISREVGILLRPDRGSVNAVRFTANPGATATETHQTAGISPLAGA